METSYIGKVLEDIEINGYDDSDFCAVVWDDEAGCTKTITYGSTRAWTYPNRCIVDATAEVREKHEAWKQRAAEERRIIQAKKAAASVAKGKVVRVVKGRKVSHGMEGLVFWVGPCKYNRNATRVGVILTNGDKVFLDAASVSVVELAQVFV